MFTNVSREKAKHGKTVVTETSARRRPTGAEDLFAVVASWCEIVFMALRTVEQFVTYSKLGIDQRLVTVAAVETRRMPVMVVVLQILHPPTHHHKE